MLLFCCWVAWRFDVHLDVATLKILTGAISPFHENITAPLRTARKQLMQHTGSLSPEMQTTLKRHFISLELQAERAEQMILISRFNSSHPATAQKLSAESLAHQNIMSYLRDILQLPLTNEPEEIGILTNAVAML